MKRIRYGQLPHLRHLCIDTCGDDSRHGHVLGEVLRGGVCPQLEDLIVGGTLGDEGARRLVEGLKEGSCPKLKWLDLAETDMGAEAAGSLAVAITSGGMADLRKLLLEDNVGIGDEAVAEVVTNLRSCHHLEELHLGATAMESMSCAAIHHALRDGMWPYLRTLVLDYHREDDVLDLAALISTRGAARRLRHIIITVLWSDDSRDVAQHLLNAIRYGRCPALKEVIIRTASEEGDELTLKEPWEMLQEGEQQSFSYLDSY